MMNSSAEAFAPATMANLGVGFDILGLALLEPGDIVRAELSDQPGVQIIDQEYGWNCRSQHPKIARRFPGCKSRYSQKFTSGKWLGEQQCQRGCGGGCSKCLVRLTVVA